MFISVFIFSRAFPLEYVCACSFSLIQTEFITTRVDQKFIKKYVTWMRLKP